MRFNNYLYEWNPDDLYMLEGHWKSVEEKCSQVLKALRSCSNKKLLFRGMGDIVRDIPFIKDVRKDRKPKDTHEGVSRIIDDMFYDKFGFRPRSQGLFCFGMSSKNPFLDDIIDFGQSYVIFPIGNFKFIWSPQIDDFYVYMIKHSISKKSVALTGDKSVSMESWKWKYGKGAFEGTWKFQDITIEVTDKKGMSQRTAIERVMLEFTKEDITELPKDIYNKLYDGIKQDLEWIPVVPFPSFLEAERSSAREGLLNMVESYKKTNFCEALKSGNEITIFCDKYYCFNANCLDFIRNKVYE